MFLVWTGELVCAHISVHLSQSFLTLSKNFLDSVSVSGDGDGSDEDDDDEDNKFLIRLFEIDNNSWVVSAAEFFATLNKKKTVQTLFTVYDTHP